MNIISVNNQIKKLLSNLDYATLPNYPNIQGFIAQSTITFIVGSGKLADDDYCDLELRISIACAKRTADDEKTIVEEFDEKVGENLDELIALISNKFHKRPLKGTKPILFKNFEISPPQSGKWRALVLFTIPQGLESEYEKEIDSGEPLTKVIDRQYLPSDL